MDDIFIYIYLLPYCHQNTFMLPKYVLLNGYKTQVEFLYMALVLTKWYTAFRFHVVGVSNIYSISR